jgi:hypothetical protein
MFKAFFGILSLFILKTCPSTSFSYLLLCLPKCLTLSSP